MSVKRVASTDLNHENWDKEDPSEQETMGTYKTASKEEIEKRVIRTAKRRSQASSDEAKKSVFSGFGGFNKTQPSSYDFLANLTNGSKTNGAGTKSDTAVTSSLFSTKPTPAPSGGLFGMPQQSIKSFSTTPQTSSPFVSTATKEIPSMIFSSSKADSTVGDTPFKMQSVSSSADSNVKTSTAQVSSTIFGVSSTSPSQKLSSTTTAFKQPVSSTSTSVQNSAAIATQSKPKIEATSDKEETEKARNKYYSKLKGLNESVSSWIVKHVEKTPLCFLSPIFKDYENYLKQIQEEYEATKKDIEAKSKQMEVKPLFGFKDTASSFTNQSPGSKDAKPNQPFGITNTSTGLFAPTSASSSISPSKTTTPTKGFSFGVTSTPASTSPLFPAKAEATSQKPALSFGIKPPNEPVSPPSKGFSFNANSAFAANTSNVSSPPSKGFSLGVPTPTATPPKITSPFKTGENTGSPMKAFSFGMAGQATTSPTNTATGAPPFSFGIGSTSPFSFKPQTQQQTTDTKEDEEDQPPKVEFTPVVEENSVFDKKCKVFVKKDGVFADKGVGTLYVKKIQESGKHQLLVRANTNLGTVLLNLILASGVPTQLTGKNNVMLICIPTPDAKPPPTTVLIRVKTAEEAKELLDILEKFKS